MNNLYQMIEQTSIKHDKLLRKLTQPLTIHFGITYFCYQYVSNDGDWFTFSNNVDWLNYSAQHQFFKSDPSLVHPSHYNESSVCFPLNHQYKLFQQTLIHDARQIFNLDHTLGLIEPSPHGCEFYFFCAPCTHTKVSEIYFNYINLLRRDYVRYIQENLQPLFSQCINYSIKLNKLNYEGFNSQQNILSVIEKSKQEVAFLQDINQFVTLSQREQQCLYWYKQGLTAKQTGKMMNLSHRTIEDYYESLKTKYNVSSKKELLGTRS